MAPLTSTRRSYQKPLSNGKFEWKDELRGREICSSTLEITEQGHNLHVLDFRVIYEEINGESYFTVKVNYLEGYPKNILINFDLIVRRNCRFKLCLCRFRPKPKPVKMKDTITWKMQDNYVQQTHQITNDFDSNVKVNVDLHLYINEVKPRLTDETEPTMEEAIGNLYFNNECSDTKIVCEGKEFPCHKFILSLRSSVFKTMFTSDLKINDDEEESTLKIEDISAETMSLFIEFLYTDEIQPEDIDPDLLIAADKYNVKRLVNICRKHLESIIDVKNVMTITLAAYLIDNEQLLQKASKFITENVGGIKKPEQWDQIKKTHPHIATKVMDMIVFENQPSSQG